MIQYGPNYGNIVIIDATNNKNNIAKATPNKFLCRWVVHFHYSIDGLETL